MKESGEWSAKCRKEYDLDGRGQRIRLPGGGFKSHRVNTKETFEFQDNVVPQERLAKKSAALWKEMN